MSSNKRAVLLSVLTLAFAGSVFAQNTAKPEGISCPASIKATASATAPAGWALEAPTSEHALERMSVFQKSATNEVFDLAPDRSSRQVAIVQQVWTVPHDPEMKTYLQCRYRATDATLILVLRPEIKACRFKFMADRHGAVTEVLSMSCK